MAFAIKQSGYDKKIAEHFRYSARGYKFESNYKAFQKELEDFTSADWFLLSQYNQGLGKEWGFFYCAYPISASVIVK